MSYFQKYLFLIILFSANLLVGQKEVIPLADMKFRKGGDVSKLGANCYQLTSDRGWSSGAIWYPSPINLAEDFEMEVALFLGCRDEGADGIVFIFSSKLRIGYSGEGMGFAGLYPSLGIEFDTYQNHHLGDPSKDHIAVMSNGQINHVNYVNNLAGPIEMSNNLEDCKNHKLKVLWKAKEKELLVSLDGANIIGFQKNIVADIFNEDPKVYWGFSAATGGKRNAHRICFEKLAFDELPKPIAFNKSKETTILNGDITTLDNVLFESGKATLKKGSTTELTKLLALLQAHPKHHIGIYGHTDAIGDERKNAQLSQKRADAIIDYLVANGINKKRLSAKGLGEQYPISSNGTAAGRLKNRRVEIYLYIPIP